MTNGSLLHNIDLFVLDLDGTIYLGDTLIDGAKEFLNAIRAAGITLADALLAKIAAK